MSSERARQKSDFIREFIEKALQALVAQARQPGTCDCPKPRRQFEQLRAEMIERVAPVIERPLRRVRIERVI